MERELTSKIDITEGQCRKFYEDNKGNWTEPEQVRVQHVLLATMNPGTGLELSEADKARKRQVAEHVRNLAMQNQKFTDLVLNFSEDPGTRRAGGEYTFARGVMAPEFERVSFALQINQVSRVVETQFGYHVIRMVQRIPQKVKSFIELQKEIRKHLAEQETSARLPVYYKKLREGAGVKVTLGD
jgi:peptidyl-prolyl cis-trans isomerase C